MSYLSIGLATWHPTCIQLKADLKMTSLFYGFSALLMAAAHYTLCDETSVVEASTGVSMWGDLAAGWLLANHNNLNVLLIVGIVWFGACIVGSILKSVIEKDDKIWKAAAHAAWVAENDRQLIEAVEDRENDACYYRCIALLDQMDKQASNIENSVDSVNKRLDIILDNDTSATPQNAPAATLSVISPHNTHLLVEAVSVGDAIVLPPLMPIVVVMDEVPAYAKASLTGESLIGFELADKPAFVLPNPRKPLGLLATPKRHTPDGGFYYDMDRPTSLPRKY